MAWDGVGWCEGEGKWKINELQKRGVHSQWAGWAGNLADPTQVHNFFSPCHPSSLPSSQVEGPQGTRLQLESNTWLSILPLT